MYIYILTLAIFDLIGKKDEPFMLFHSFYRTMHAISRRIYV